jgi:Domain of unknown function (DUF4440)
MKYIAVGWVGVTVAATSMAQSRVEAEKELIRIQNEWATARIKGDVAFLEHLYAKEFRITSMNGSVVTRDADIGVFRSGEMKPESIVGEDMKVSVYDNTAIVTGVEGFDYPVRRDVSHPGLTHDMTRPPVTSRVAPVIHEEADDRRKRVAAATSRG